MYNQNNQSMMNPAMNRPTFLFPTQLEGSFTDEELAEDMEGITISFPRAKIPGGGTLQFELTGENPDEPDYAKVIEGVIVATNMANAYWPEGSEYDDDAPPLCQSVDGKIGYGTPGGMCQDCQLNCFGSGKNGSGKACKNMRMLYILRSGETMPLQLSLPPTSLKGYNDFVSAAFLNRRRRICSGLIQISLKKVSNSAHEYSVAVFKKLCDFTGEELAAVIQLSNEMRKQIADINQQRANSHAAHPDVICEYPTSSPLPENGSNFVYTETIPDEHGQRQANNFAGNPNVVRGYPGSSPLPDNGSHFMYGGVIDGEREVLP